MFFIDGDTQPTINGTGTEDYFNGAWGYNGEPFAYMHNGTPFCVKCGPDWRAALSVPMAYGEPDCV